MLRAAKVDANQPAIVAALRLVGAYVVITSQLKNAFDCLVAYRGQLYIVEIKDGAKPKSKRELTPGELLCRNKFAEQGIEYHVIESVEQALKLIGK